MSELKTALKQRVKSKRKKPTFIRQEGKHKKKLVKKWVRPKGKQSKMRKCIKGKGHIPNVGYGSPNLVKGLHPSGLEDILVHNVDDVKKVDAKKQGIRIAATVGNKKRYFMQKQAEELKIRVFNLKKIELREKKK